MTAQTENANKYPVKALVKALRLLDTLALSPSGCGVTELGKKLELGKSTVHRLLGTLREEGYVVNDPTTSKYVLGSKVARLAQHLSLQYPMLTFGVPLIKRLARDYNETVNMAVLEDLEVVYIAGEEGREMLRSHFVLGYRARAHTTALGKVMLASFSDNEVMMRYRRFVTLPKSGPRTITTVSRLLKELALIRKNGFAFDDEESGPGVVCIAVPVRDSSGIAVAGISFSMPVHRVNASRKVELRGALVRASAELSKAIGYVPAKKKRG